MSAAGSGIAALARSSGYNLYRDIAGRALGLTGRTCRSRTASRPLDLSGAGTAAWNGTVILAYNMDQVLSNRTVLRFYLDGNIIIAILKLNIADPCDHGSGVQSSRPYIHSIN